MPVTNTNYYLSTCTTTSKKIMEVFFIVISKAGDFNLLVY